eukprot:690152_1
MERNHISRYFMEQMWYKERELIRNNLFVLYKESSGNAVESNRLRQQIVDRAWDVLFRCKSKNENLMGTHCTNKNSLNPTHFMQQNNSFFSFLPSADCIC